MTRAASFAIAAALASGCLAMRPAARGTHGTAAPGPAPTQTAPQDAGQDAGDGLGIADTLASINQSFQAGDVHYALTLSADQATLTWTEADPDGTTLVRTAPAAALDPSRIDPAINGTVGDLDIACRGGRACARAGGRPVNSFYVQGFAPDDDPLAAAQDAMHHLLVLLQSGSQPPAR